jgi:hypothetical protein
LTDRLRQPALAAMAAASPCLTFPETKRVTVPAGSVPSSFLVKGKYIEFTVDAATFGVRDWTFTGVPNPLDITGGQRTTVFASKMPDHRGLVLNSGVSVNSSRESLVLTRTGPGLSMKIQVKDCANGGVFQMEVERGDATATCSRMSWATVCSILIIRTFAIGWARICRAPVFCPMALL